jgi:hypothetical protein
MEAGVYKHYKGGLYQVLGIGQHTETEELLVVYISLTGAELPGPRIRIRPLNGPNGFNTWIRSDPNRPIPRFKYVGVSVE